jgi:hypothetical protein
MKGKNPFTFMHEKEKQNAKCGFEKEIFEVEEAWSHNLSPRLRREIRQILFEHFNLIVEVWNRHLGGRENAGN